MEIVNKNIDELIPYLGNPRSNDAAVKYVAESIMQFGFKVPIVIDRRGVIVCGHTRLKAAKRVGMDFVPCVVADDLTDEQVAAFRLADNKVAELSSWDFELLDGELAALEGSFEMDRLGFKELEELASEMEPKGGPEPSGPSDDGPGDMDAAPAEPDGPVDGGIEPAAPAATEPEGEEPEPFEEDAVSGGETAVCPCCGMEFSLDGCDWVEV